MWLGRRRQEDFAQEVEAHLELEADQLRAEGLAPEDAHAAARRAFGNLTSAKERFYEASRIAWLDQVVQDIRYAVRRLRKSPAFVAAAVLVLALGTGANTAVFSFVNGLLLRSLPFSDLDRLVTVRESNTQGFKLPMAAPGDFVDWRAQAPGFESLAGYVFRDYSLGGGKEPEGAFGVQVSARFFEALGVRPALGRAFLPEEETAGRNRVVIISHRLWVRRFGSDRNMVGRTIVVDETPHVLVGVMAQDFEFPFPGVEIWSPLSLTDAERTDRREHFVVTVGRLKPEVSINQARAELSAVARRLEIEHPLTNSGRGVEVVALRDQQGDFTRPFLVLMQAAAILVLLIACANVANLQLANAASRRKEMALRAALGATQGRLVRLMLAESLLLSLAGGAVGAAFADWGIRLRKSGVPKETTRYLMGWSQISLDWTVLGFALAASVVSGIVFGLSAALRASQSQLSVAMKEGGATGQTPGMSRLRHLLAASEVVLAVVIVICAAQTVKGFHGLLDVHQGFSPQKVLTTRLVPPRRHYPKPADLARFYDLALRAAASVPGVSSAAAVSNLPGGLRYNFTETFEPENPAPGLPGQEASTEAQYISADYFRTFAIPVTQGRPFTLRDASGALPVAVVSEAFARRYLGGPDPIGKRIRLAGSRETWRTIVGVAADVRQNWFEREPGPMLYLPYKQSPNRQMYLVVRTSGDPMSLLPAIREEIRKIDSNLPLFDPKPMPEVIEEAIAGMRTAAGVMAAFGAISLVLAVLGIYGVMSYGVAQRRREFGIRMALGASRMGVLRLVIRQGSILASVGIGVGLVAALVVTRLMSALLYGLSSTNLALLGSIAAIVAVTILIACYIPARAAARVDPITALRHE